MPPTSAASQTQPPKQRVPAKQCGPSIVCPSPSYPAPKLTTAGELCSKGYARMNEYEAHLSSYDHSHKQRLKDMRQLTRDPLASSKARKAEAKANSQSGLISIKIGEGGSSAGGSGGFKKAGFKKAGFKSAFAPADGEGVKEEERTEIKEEKRELPGSLRIVDQGESDTEDEGYEIGILPRVQLGSHYSVPMLWIAARSLLIWDGGLIEDACKIRVWSSRLVNDVTPLDGWVDSSPLQMRKLEKLYLVSQSDVTPRSFDLGIQTRLSWALRISTRHRDDSAIPYVGNANESSR
ncbi:hypothetical protein VTL71DRAFT_6654 [Oculimacula yallundae]|uniref:C2H2-type domain-containing protein n=1 Tax=Oculimacula yallundae TaxID=86028 RepID=A0ABR4BXM4_9HELO